MNETLHSSRLNKGAEIIYLIKTLQDVILSLDLTNCVLFDRQITNGQTREIFIRHPFTPDQIKMTYGENGFLNRTQQIAQQASLDPGHPNATVIVNQGIEISHGANGSNYHSEHGCERKRLHMPTGQGYELCEGCHPKNHSEATAIQNARALGRQDKLKGSTAHLYGHWWCCESCCQKMVEAGITAVIFSKPWTAQFLEIDLA